MNTINLTFHSTNDPFEIIAFEIIAFEIIIALNLYETIIKI